MENQKKVIVKYENRKFYDKDIKGYININKMKEYVKDDIEFVVLKHKNKEDITHTVLTSIFGKVLNKI